MAGQKRPGVASAGLLALAVVCGCGSTYRPVVAPISPTGPAAQPSSTVAVVSLQNTAGTAPSPTAAGVVTVLDFAGDSIMASGYIGPNPIGFAMGPSGGSGFALNSDETLSTFPVSSSSTQKPLSELVLSTTLLPGTSPVNAFSNSSSVYLADSGHNEVDYLTGSPVSLKQAIPVGTAPITVVGNSGGQRIYAISQMLAFGTCSNPAQSTNGNVYSIETLTNTVSTVIPVGICPVYGIVSADSLRVFILNRGSGTITVINGQTNQFLQTINVGAGPVFADIYKNASILATANYDSNTVSFIDVTTDVYGNNGPNFGKVLANVPVGSHPSSVSVLQDGTRAYTANQGDGTVSVIDMSSFTVKKTITVPTDPGTPNIQPTPRSVAAVSNALIGKVYVTSPASTQVVIIRTDTDSITATVQLPGNAVELHPSAQVAGGTNSVIVSHTAGSGAP